MPIVAMRGAIHRLDRAFIAFFRRCNNGEKPGFPRFKMDRRWDTIEFDNPIKSGPIVAGGKRVKVPGLGKVKLRYHRVLEGRPRTMQITHASDGHWYVLISCDGVATKPLPATDAVVGVDLGLTTLATTSDGEKFDNPRPLRVARISLERAQRRVSRRKRGSKRYEKAVRLLAKCHAHIANMRRENAIIIARSLVERYDIVVVEDLNLKGLTRGVFAKSFHDAGCGVLLRWIATKAEEAARENPAVNPAGTTINCSDCGEPVPKTLSDRVHRCPRCGLVLCRDVNAARNILRLGTSLQGEARAVRRPQRSAKRTTTTRRPGHARLPSMSDA